MPSRRDHELIERAFPIERQFQAPLCQFVMPFEECLEGSVNGVTLKEVYRLIYVKQPGALEPVSYMKGPKACSFQPREFIPMLFQFVGSFGMAVNFSKKRIWFVALSQHLDPVLMMARLVVVHVVLVVRGVGEMNVCLKE